MKRGLIAALVLLAALAGLFAFVRDASWMAQDRCLDHGGVWRDGVCVGERPSG